MRYLMALLALAGVLVLTACGSSDDAAPASALAPATSTTTSAPVSAPTPKSSAPIVPLIERAMANYSSATDSFAASFPALSSDPKSVEFSTIPARWTNEVPLNSHMSLLSENLGPDGKKLPCELCHEYTVYVTDDVEPSTPLNRLDNDCNNKVAYRQTRVPFAGQPAIHSYCENPYGGPREEVVFRYKGKVYNIVTDNGISVYVKQFLDSFRLTA